MTNDSVKDQRDLPDPKICRTKHLGPGLDLSKCLVEDPDACKFAIRFGPAVLCSHPDRRRFETPQKPI
jgi:hypothetical protein